MLDSTSNLCHYIYLTVQSWRSCELVKEVGCCSVVAGLVACSESAQPIKTQHEPSPLAGQEFYVDTQRQVDVALQKVTGPKAEALKRIAAQPTAFWAAGCVDKCGPALCYAFENEERAAFALHKNSVRARYGNNKIRLRELANFVFVWLNFTLSRREVS